MSVTTETAVVTSSTSSQSVPDCTVFQILAEAEIKKS